MLQRGMKIVARRIGMPGQEETRRAAELSPPRVRIGSASSDRVPPAGTPQEPSYVSVVPDPLLEMHELLTRTNYWGERADLKAAILMGGITAVFSAEIVAFGQLIGWVKEGDAIRWIPLSLLAVSLSILLIAGVTGGRSFYPQLGRVYEFEGAIAPGDLLYFARLRTIPRERISAEVRKAIAEETLIDHYAEQLQYNAQIVFDKHRQLQQGIKALALAVGVSLIAFISWVILAAG